MSQPYTPQPNQRPVHWGRWTLVTVAAASLSFAGFGALGYALRDDSSASADPTACRAAMAADFKRAAAAGSAAAPSNRPAECDGVDDATVQRYAAEITEDALGDIEP